MTARVHAQVQCRARGAGSNADCLSKYISDVIISAGVLNGFDCAWQACIVMLLEKIRYQGQLVNVLQAIRRSNELPNGDVHMRIVIIM